MILHHGHRYSQLTALPCDPTDHADHVNGMHKFSSIFECFIIDVVSNFYRYTLPDLSDTNSLFLGHSSMLLDMVL